MNRSASVALAVKLLWADLAITVIFQSVQIAVDKDSFFTLFFYVLVALLFINKISYGLNLWRCIYGFSSAFFYGILSSSFFIGIFNFSQDVEKSKEFQKMKSSSSFIPFYDFSAGSISEFEIIYYLVSTLLTIYTIYKLFGREANAYFVD